MTIAVARIAPGGAVTDQEGAVWASDAAYADAGKVWRSTSDVVGTTDDVIYQGERYGTFTYRIPVPAAATYHVEVNQAEYTFVMPGRRVFSILANGVVVAADVDIIKITGGRYRPLTLSFDVTVTDGTLVLQFLSQVNYARVSSVLVTAPQLYGSPFTGDPSAPLGGFFGPDSVFKADLSAAPVADNSPALVANLVGQVAKYYGGIAAFNVWQYTATTYTVGPGQALVNLKWDDCQHKGYVPSTLFGANGFMLQVPIPSDASPSVGSDAAITLYQPSSDTYWGFWKLNRQADGWHACWGGKIDHVSQSRGWYPSGEGVSASGLADGGSIGIKEAQAGRIDHAIGLGIPSPADWSRFSWPALRSDGSDYSADAIPEGTRFRLDPSLDVDALPISALAKMVAKAAQRYGFIVLDKAGCVGVATESGAAVAQVTGVNPWNALLGSMPSYLVMKNFPWGSLQAMPQNYGKPTLP